MTYHIWPCYKLKKKSEVKYDKRATLVELGKCLFKEMTFELRAGIAIHKDKLEAG